MLNNNFFNLSEFLGIESTLNKGTKKNAVKGETFGAKKISAQEKGITNRTEINNIDRAATPLFFEITVKSSIKPQELEKIRMGLGLTQSEIADLLGTSLSTIQKIAQEDVNDHRRDLILRYVELASLFKFLKNKNSSSMTMKRIFKTKMPNFNNLTPLDFSKKLEKSVRIYEVSGLLRRQFG